MTMHSINTEFDFNKWVKLAREDPAAYEDMRKRMIQNVIDNSPPKIKHRMEGLQWQIDQIRSSSTNPMSSCLKISQMMWDNVLGDDGLLDHMRQLSDPEQILNIRKPKNLASVTNIRSSEGKGKS